MELRTHAEKLQRIESSATEKAGLRLRLVDEAALTSRAGKAYAAEFAERLLEDIAEDAKAAARLGVELADAIEEARDRRSAEEG